jgi:hypothetical protein
VPALQRRARVRVAAAVNAPPVAPCCRRLGWRLLGLPSPLADPCRPLHPKFTSLEAREPSGSGTSSSTLATGNDSGTMRPKPILGLAGRSDESRGLGVPPDRQRTLLASSPLRPHEHGSRCHWTPITMPSAFVPGNRRAAPEPGHETSSYRSTVSGGPKPTSAPRRRHLPMTAISPLWHDGGTRRTALPRRPPALGGPEDRVSRLVVVPATMGATAAERCRRTAWHARRVMGAPWHARRGMEPTGRHPRGPP